MFALVPALQATRGTPDRRAARRDRRTPRLDAAQRAGGGPGHRVAGADRARDDAGAKCRGTEEHRRGLRYQRPVLDQAARRRRAAHYEGARCPGRRWPVLRHRADEPQSPVRRTAAHVHSHHARQCAATFRRPGPAPRRCGHDVHARVSGVLRRRSASPSSKAAVSTPARPAPSRTSPWSARRRRRHYGREAMRSDRHSACGCRRNRRPMR